MGSVLFTSTVPGNIYYNFSSKSFSNDQLQNLRITSWYAKSYGFRYTKYVH